MTLTDQIWIWLAFHCLPKKLIMWGAIRMWSHAAAVMPGREVPSITCVDALKAWTEDKEGDIEVIEDIDDIIIRTHQPYTVRQ